VSVIRTKSNMVVAYEPEPDNHWVQVVWHGPPEEGTRYCREFEGPPWPIEDYQACVDWAVDMADQMKFPLYVVPMRAQDVMSTTRVRHAIANLTDQERGELRRVVVATLAEVMRDCDDPDVRASAYDLLTDMKVVRP
jgi:hypothetical protein